MTRKTYKDWITEALLFYLHTSEHLTDADESVIRGLIQKVQDPTYKLGKLVNHGHGCKEID